MGLRLEARSPRGGMTEGMPGGSSKCDGSCSGSPENAIVARRLEGINASSRATGQSECIGFNLRSLPTLSLAFPILAPRPAQCRRQSAIKIIFGLSPAASVLDATLDDPPRILALNISVRYRHHRPCLIHTHPQLPHCAIICLSSAPTSLVGNSPCSDRLPSDALIPTRPSRPCRIPPTPSYSRLPTLPLLPFSDSTGLRSTAQSARLARSVQSIPPSAFSCQRQNGRFALVSCAPCNTLARVLVLL
jgi:hypothetical protein